MTLVIGILKMQSLKYIKFFKFVFAISFAFSVNVYANMLSECTSTANVINKSTPQLLDKVTTLMNAVCFQEGNTVTLNYRNKLDVPSGAVNQGKLNGIKPQILSTWCTDPTQRQTINLINIRYTYTDASGKFIGKIDLSKNECK